MKEKIIAGSVFVLMGWAVATADPQIVRVGDTGGPDDVLAILGNSTQEPLAAVLEVQLPRDRTPVSESGEVIVQLNDQARTWQSRAGMQLCLKAEADPRTRKLTVRFRLPQSGAGPQGSESLVLAGPSDRPGTHRQSRSGVLMRLVELRPVTEGGGKSLDAESGCTL